MATNAPVILIMEHFWELLTKVCVGHFRNTADVRDTGQITRKS